jgi:hypothetical protein
MATYKVRLLGEGGRILEEKTITALRNYEAVQAAETLGRAATRQCTGVEIWRYDRCIARREFPPRKMTATTLNPDARSIGSGGARES